MSELGCYTSTLFTPWPEELAQQYRSLGYWRGETLHQILKRQALLHPNKTALIDNKCTINYQTLLNKVENLAYSLLNFGFQPGDCVVLQMPNSIEFFEILFALMRIGVVPVLALPLHRENEIRYFCKHVEAKAYITTISGEYCIYREIAQQLKAQGYVKTIITIGKLKGDATFDSLTSKTDKHCTFPEISANNVALFQLSGGTTGTPKLIPRTHDDYFYSVRASTQVCELNTKTVYLVVMPLAHNFILSSPGSLGVLYCGGTVLIAENSAPSTAFDLIRRHSVTMAALVPPLALAWMTAFENANNRNTAPDISSLKLLQVGGAKFSATAAYRIKPVLGCKLQQVFGMAEGLVNYTRLLDTNETIAETQGKPMSPADEILIVDDNDQPVLAGTSGHLLTRGPYTIQGYFRSPEHNKRTFTKTGFYRTGDIALLTESGHLIVTGRSKDQINRGGEKIAAEEIENHCLTYPEVLDVAVVSMPDKYLGERACAFIVLKNKNSQNNEMVFKRALLNHLRLRQIAEFKIPDRVEVVNTLPKTKFGKINKQELRKMFSLTPIKINEALDLKVIPV